MAINKTTHTLMKLFYGHKTVSLSLRKEQRDNIYRRFEKSRCIDPKWRLESICPPMLIILTQYLESKKLVQSSIFSELVYTQALANTYDLPYLYYGDQMDSLLSSHPSVSVSIGNMVPRFIYTDSEETRFLVEGGGSNEIDTKYFDSRNSLVCGIEDKEFVSKTSEADLKNGDVFAYGENGLLTLATVMKLMRKPTLSQYGAMLLSAADNTNILKAASILNQRGTCGININNFSSAQVNNAVSTNYALNKHADVIVTEANGHLVMFPAQDLDVWARSQGEIRPAGRNSTTITTLQDFKKAILALDGRIQDSMVTLDISKTIAVHPRGGRKTITSRYKLANRSIYFVRAKDVVLTGTTMSFNIKKVRQLIPTIAAKMDFRSIDEQKIRKTYDL